MTYWCRGKKRLGEREWNLGHESGPPRHRQAHRPQSQRGVSLWAETRNIPTRQDSGSARTSLLTVFFLTDQETRLSVEREGREGSERCLREKNGVDFSDLEKQTGIC